MENLQDVVLEIAAFADIQFKHLALVRVQAHADKKLERALRELLQPAHGRAQGWAVKFLCQRWRKVFRLLRLAQRRETFYE